MIFGFGLETVPLALIIAGAVGGVLHYAWKRLR